MLKPLLKGQRGFTLIELLAVMAILAILAAMVAGSVVGMGSQGQTARLEGDRDTVAKAADRFFNQAFPQAYPVVTCCTVEDDTPQVMLEVGDRRIRLIDFDAVLPGDPTKTFVPNFLQEIPNTAALVSWRLDLRNGKVFFAQDFSQLVRPSTNRLKVSASATTAATQSDHTLELRMKKDEAALEVLTVAIPAGYSVGGQGLESGTPVGTFSGAVATDNPWRPGQVLPITGSLTATGQPNRWELFVDYPPNSESTSTVDRADRTHQVTIVPPSIAVAGKLTIQLDATGDPAHHQASETWTLTIHGQVAVGSTVVNVITNPSSRGAYRWLAEEHTSIDVKDFFDRVAGNQAVVIKAAATSSRTPTPNPAPLAAVLPFSNTADLYVLDQGSKNILRIAPTGAVNIAVTQAQITAATQAASVSFLKRSIAFDTVGTLYFTEGVSGSIIRDPPEGTLTVLTPKTVSAAALSGAGDPGPSSLAAMAFCRLCGVRPVVWAM